MKLIFIKELKEIIQSSRFTISFSVCSLLIILSFVMGANNYLTSLEQYRAAVQENRNQIAGNTDWNQVDHTISLEPQPLMALVTGISNDIGRNVDMQTQGELRAENTRFNDEPIFAVFRFMDLEFIFGIVLSLFAIIFAYDSINGEKAKGTLKLCFSNSISRASFIGGKLLGSFLGLSNALLLPILIGVALLPVFGIHLSADEWIRLGLILLTGMAFFGVFLTIAITISALTKHPSSSFLISLVIWIAAVLIIPRASVLISGRLVDVPNIDEISAQKSRYRAQLWEEDRPKLNNFSAPTGTNPQELMQQFSSFMSELSRERQQKIDAFDQKLNQEYQNRVRQREKLALTISRISPASLFTMAITSLAGTSLQLENRFIEQVNSYQITYASFMKEKTGRDSGGFRMIINSDQQQQQEPLDPDEVPQFEFNEASLSDTLSASLPDMGLLILLNFLFFGTAFSAFLNYDLR